MQSIRFDFPDAFAPITTLRGCSTSGPGSRNESILLSVSDRMNIATRPILADSRLAPTADFENGSRGVRSRV
jgi:hypothetical protein